MRTRFFFGFVAMTLLNLCKLIQDEELLLDSETSNIIFFAIIRNEVSTRTALSDKTKCTVLRDEACRNLKLYSILYK